jgi:hypothetical protein
MNTFAAACVLKRRAKPWPQQTSSNFQETISGQLKDVFLHVFEAASINSGGMTTGHAMRSVDRNVQGVEVTASGKTWAVLFAAYDRAFAGSVQYQLPSSGAHGHPVNDLLPLTPYTVSVTSANGDVQRTLSLTTDANGTLSFDTTSGESTLYLTPGTIAPDSWMLLSVRHLTEARGRENACRDRPPGVEDRTNPAHGCTKGLRACMKELRGWMNLIHEYQNRLWERAKLIHG